MRRTLLIVDDISTNREILKKILGGEYDILEAGDGSEALSLMRREGENISAVLLDLAMPVMDGFELLEMTQNDAKLSHIPVIVTTGQTELESEVRALELGANDYIAKPYNSAIIKRRIRNTINLRETAAAVNLLQRDSLTGLYQREVFFEKARAMILAREPGFYVMSSLNIDGFKVINDQYGAQKGDMVLKHVADCLSRHLAKTDAICSRVCADSFAAVYPAGNLGSQDLENFRREMSAPACIDRPIHIRTGRYLIDDLSIPISAMYDRASMAESSIKGRYDETIAMYDESMRERMLREQEIVNEMRSALSSGQFEVWLQPQFNHSSRALIGAEALVRWRHPERGLISPGVFIPVFERNGFIYELDKFVWGETARLLRKWLDKGFSPLPVSVNISRYDLLRGDIVEAVCAPVEKYSLPEGLLRLEITESAFAGEDRRIINAVTALTSRGFTIEIDDFGSGYSSLNTLKDVPADILKLDMRFLENGRNPERGGNILESIVRMARWLGIPVIAEGVETVSQAEFLKSIGCYYIQGFLYARPMPAREYESFFMDYRKDRDLLNMESCDMKNTESLWDPASMETLIFNSFGGGACIFEYYDGKLDLLRINESYVRELGGGLLSPSEAFALKPERCLDGENLSLLLSCIRRTAQEGSESGCELRLDGIGAKEAQSYIRCDYRLMAKAGERALIYCTVRNMSALREAAGNGASKAQARGRAAKGAS